MKTLRIISLILAMQSFPGSVFAQTPDSLGDDITILKSIKRPDPILQSIAGSIFYTGSFFLLNGNFIIHNFDSSSKGLYGPTFTFLASSFFSALAVSIAGDLTATRGGGSYLSTLTVGFLVSYFSTILSNKIYTGDNPSLRFSLSLIPSVASLVTINQLYFDGNKLIIKDINERSQGYFSPMVGPSFLGLSFSKEF